MLQTRPEPANGEGGAVIGFLVRPWRGMTLWRSLAWEALDFPLGLVVGISVTVLVALSVGFAVTFVIAIPLVWFTFLIAAQLGRIERSRAAALLGVNLASPHAPFAPGNWWSRLRQRVTSASRWREIGYLSLGLPIQGALGVAVLALWSATRNYVVHLRPEAAVTADSGQGDVSVADMGGTLSVHSGQGDVTIIGGSDTLQASSGQGNVTVSRSAATSVSVHSDQGDVAVGLVVAPRRVNASSGQGNVTVELPRGPDSYQVNASSGQGNVSDTVDSDPASHRVVNASSDQGDVTVGYR